MNVRARVSSVSPSTNPYGEALVTLVVDREVVDDYRIAPGSVFELDLSHDLPRRKKVSRKRAKQRRK